MTETSKSREAASATSGSAGPYFLVRLILLVVWLVGVDLWLAHHTGHGLRDPGVIGGIGGLLILVLWAAAKVIATVDKALWDALPGQLVRAAVHGPTLAGLYLVAAFFMLNLSSIVVIQDQEPNPGRVTVNPLGGAGTLPNWLCRTTKNPARRCVWTGPFGSTFQVSVQGYLGQSVEVYPLVGAKLRPERTFRRLPTLLIRPSRNAIKSLGSCEAEGGRCGQFRLCRVEENTCRALVTLEGHSGSFLIGWTQAVPAGLVQDWVFELTAQGLAEQPKVRAEMIIAWKNYKRLVPGSALGDTRVPLISPGTRLRAEVRTKIPARPLVSCREFVVEDLAFMDVAMVSTVPSGVCPP